MLLVKILLTNPTLKLKEAKSKVLNLLPTTLKKCGTMLIDHFLSHPLSSSRQWNDIGELIVNGKSIQCSNIVDLIYDVLKGRKSSQPIGWQHFLRVSIDSNVPESLLSNVKRRTLLKKIKSKTLTGSAPPPSLPKVLPLIPILTTTTKPTSVPLRSENIWLDLKSQTWSGKAFKFC